MKTALSIFVLLALSCFLLRCEDPNEENITPVSLVTITVDPSFPTATNDNWVIVHDENGEVLEYASFESGDNLLIETTKTLSGNTIGITLLKHVLENESHYYVLDTYLSIGIGETFPLKRFKQSVPPAPTGQYHVTVQGMQAIDQFSITDRFSSSCGGSGTSTQLTFDCSISGSTGKHILQLSDNTGNLRYKVLDNETTNASYDIAFDQMSTFDQTVDFTFPVSNSVFLMVMGREHDQSIFDNSYLLNYHYQNDSHTQIKAGYLNSLSNYTTHLTIAYTEHRYSYINMGSIPDPNIQWPSKSDFSISSKSIRDFSSTASKPFVWRSSSWSHDALATTAKSRIAWNISSDSETHRLGDLPSAILSEHPALSLDNLKPSTTTFYTVSQPYQDYVSSNLAQEEWSADVQMGIMVW